jgi:hypothetical protein
MLEPLAITSSYSHRTVQREAVEIRTQRPLQQPEERTKGSGSRVACLAMVFKLSEAAAKKWRRLNGAELVRDVIDGVQFKDGKRAEDAA